MAPAALGQRVMPPTAPVDCSIPAGVVRIRPDPDGTPTKVSVGLIIIDVKYINEVNQTFSVDFGTPSCSKSQPSRNSGICERLTRSVDCV